MNLLPDGLGGHSENLHKHIRNPILFLYELAPGRLWQPLVPDSTVLTTFADLLGIQHFDFMNLLTDGFGRRGPILYYSDDLHKHIRNPILVLYQSAPGQLWRRGPILLYSDNLRRSIRNWTKLPFMNFLLDCFGSHKFIFQYPQDFHRLLEIHVLFLYEFAPWRLWQERAHFPQSWWPSHTYTKSNILPLWIFSRAALAGYGSIFHYSDNLHKPNRNLCFYTNWFLDSFCVHWPIFHYSENLHKTSKHPILFPYEFAPGWLWWFHLLATSTNLFGNPILFRYEFDPG